MGEKSFAKSWTPRRLAINSETQRSELDEEPRSIVPQGWLGVATVLAVWAMLTAAAIAAQSLTRVRGSFWVSGAIAALTFVLCLVGTQVIQRRELQRALRRRRAQQAFFQQRRHAYASERNYYVTDLFGAKRGPYTLERVSLWYVEGKLGDEPLIYIKDAATPSTFMEVARDWRRRWGPSPLDPAGLRSN